ncbi:MAG: glycosyltransferase family 4 protein [Tannerellaceae bacterium]|jgi:glycosyltransferase involved in cell wall biosynthesis|nr:glycosyltransferase family 4 protein [Tannerellaceae bacterium]
MKTPNTGLFHFCLNLVNTLYQREQNERDTLSVFAQPRVQKFLPPGIAKFSKHFWHAYYLRFPDNCKVWHSTFQLDKYMPSSDRQKKVLTIHDLNFLYDRNQKGLKVEMKRLQHNIDLADKLVAISEFAKKDILTHMDTHGKDIDVIYNGCNIYNGVIRAPHDFSPQKPFLLALGTVLAKKNFHVLPCLLQNNDYTLLIIGNMSSYAKVIMDEAAYWGVADRVHIIGAVSEAVKHWYLQNCEAFLFPSIAEGFGMPVVEAMSYGKPVFLSLHTALPEIGGDVAVYFNTNFDRKEMQQEFEQGMKMYQTTITAEMIKNQAGKFSWDRAAGQYWEIYQTLINT